jgi:hypothetical protein
MKELLVVVVVSLSLFSHGVFVYRRCRNGFAILRYLKNKCAGM